MGKHPPALILLAYLICSTLLVLDLIQKAD